MCMVVLVELILGNLNVLEKTHHVTDSLRTCIYNN